MQIARLLPHLTLARIRNLLPVDAHDEAGVAECVHGDAQADAEPQAVDAVFHADADKVGTEHADDEVIHNGKKLDSILLAKCLDDGLQVDLKSVHLVEKTEYFQVLKRFGDYARVLHNTLNQNVAIFTDEDY